MLLEPKCFLGSDRRTDVTKLIVAFHNFSKEPGNCAIELAACAAIEIAVRKVEFVLSFDKIFQRNTQDCAAFICTVGIV